MVACRLDADVRSSLQFRASAISEAIRAEPGKPVTGPATWYSRDLQDRPDIWVYHLSDAAVEELDAAIHSIQASAVDLKNITRDDISLPTLGPKLHSIRNELVRGRGFQLIRGIPVERYSLEQSVIAFWCIGLYLGRARPQNGRQHLLGHVRASLLMCSLYFVHLGPPKSTQHCLGVLSMDADIDLPGGASNPVNRGYTTSAAQPWHVDESDIVGLLCLKTAKEGGHSQWASSGAIHNEMLRQQPELYQELLRPMYVDRKNEVPVGKLPWYQMPVYNFYKGRLTVYYVSSYYQVCQRHHPATPLLTDRQTAALAEFDTLASSPDLVMNWVLQPGDVQLLNNHVTVHNRSAYVDHPAEKDRRHLLRLWLCPEDGDPLPECYAERYGSVEIGNRGGIWIPGPEPHVPLHPKSGLPQQCGHSHRQS